LSPRGIAGFSKLQFGFQSSSTPRANSAHVRIRAVAVRTYKPISDFAAPLPALDAICTMHRYQGRMKSRRQSALRVAWSLRIDARDHRNEKGSVNEHTLGNG
jgi:hypothetical protein